MKLKIFSYVFWPEQFLINDLAHGFVERGHDVEVITGMPNYPKGHFFEGYSLRGPYRESYRGVMVSRFPMLPRRTGFFFLFINYISNLLGACIRVFTVDRGDWAFVFATSPIITAIPAIFWAKMRGGRVAIWLQDLWPDSVAAVGALERKSFTYHVLGRLVRWIYRRSDLILIQSPAFSINLDEFGYKGPYYFLPNWAPSFDFPRYERPSWLAPKLESLTITFAGNVGRAQSIDTIMHAALELIDDGVMFNIVGDGAELSRARHFVSNMNLTNIRFYGRRAIEDMPGLFAHSDALLVTLGKDPVLEKVIPSKIQAYMAAGRPIIGSLDGVGRYLVESEQIGFCGSAEDVSGLVNAVRRFCASSVEERDEMGVKARRYFLANFHKDDIIDRAINFLEKHR